MKKASPKQMAFLTFMGFENIDHLSLEEASELIDNMASYFPDEKFNAHVKKKNEWRDAKFQLYPDLYQNQLVDYLSEKLRGHVRSVMKGASGKLTKAKVTAVCENLNSENPEWWRDIAQAKISFYAKLSEMYPRCTDGETIIKKVAIKPAKIPLPPPIQEEKPQFKKPEKIYNLGCFTITSSLFVFVFVTYKLISG